MSASYVEIGSVDAMLLELLGEKITHRKWQKGGIWLNRKGNYLKILSKI